MLNSAIRKMWRGYKSVMMLSRIIAIRIKIHPMKVSCYERHNIVNLLITSFVIPLKVTCYFC